MKLITSDYCDAEERSSRGEQYSYLPLKILNL